MIRQIKFRAWDEEAQRMSIVPHLIFLADGTHKVIAGEDFIWSPIILEYTGLKDKNGKEIWEGDIIEWQWDYGVQEKKEIVMHSLKWDEQISEEQAPFMSAWGSTCGKYYRTFMNVYDPTRYAEVIGNMYENPDLLF